VSQPRTLLMACGALLCRLRRRVRWAVPAIALGATVGCFSSAPIVPVTPANTDQVSSCQSIATTHNAVVVGDFVVGGASASLAGVDAIVSDAPTKNGLAIGAAIAGALGIVGTAVAGYTGQEFANGQCPNVVGNLPAGAPR
jgi:hypothetical protein